VGAAAHFFPVTLRPAPGLASVQASSLPASARFFPVTLRLFAARF